MIRDLKGFYVAILDNEVVCYGTNLLRFHSGFKELEPNIKSYSYFYREFKKRKVIDFTNKKKQTYFLQELF